MSEHCLRSQELQGDGARPKNQPVTAVLLRSRTTLVADRGESLRNDSTDANYSITINKQRL